MEKIRNKSWVGSIYHKFEAVCLEVDEFVTKDTVKYVGDQVQTVGANMKKLYSGVVQDFLIPMDDNVKGEAQAVNGKPKHSVDTYTSSVTNTTPNPSKEQSYLDQGADNSIESHNASTSTELDGVVASEEAEIDFCKNSHKVFKENITRENALVDDESSTSEDRISSESCSDKDSKDTMCYSFSDDDKCFFDVSSSQIILQDHIVKEEQPMAEGSSSFLDNLSRSQLRASKNDQTFDSSPDDINCISNIPSSQTDLQRNFAREVQPVTDQSNSFGDIPFSMGERHGNSITAKLPHPTSLYDAELGTFQEDKRGCDAAKGISNIPITQTNLQDNITSEDQLASNESSSANGKSLPQTSAFGSDIPPTSRNDAGFGLSMTARKSFSDDLTCVSEKSSTVWAFEDAPSTLLSSELVLSRVQGNESGVSNSSLLAESSSLSTSLIGNCTQEAESDSSISTGLSFSLSTSLANASNVVSVISALSSTPSLTDFSGCMNDSSIDLPDMETIDLTDKGKLRESCVLIDNKLHNRVSFRPRKYKSYKELIQEAFASRKRLIKEYKQLAVLYADVDVETSQHSELSQLPSLPSPCLHSTESSTCNICESGWELL
ncbi:uncharacterized protein LOC132036631 isoform X1 [Lycium ferocissimum]|uniref:uncharacterized protein LOC132036631 isoform X1 n=2 Tax=Lycium ferocissimum TaxID=112874 RepID=UPI0028152879|nr:uncharacterized protein LOC132036631 isoform X1 [Lycium ferocissimum]XP_059282992.1 uncharacterized protein LOC132036631 isoform X1 [Lycium ferocissimum]XP_059282994.1 uncharacterized protein LOC132036631 isoform X1 [Lycium ferocissimum]